MCIFNRDLKIENLLLDEQDNIKLIGKRYHRSTQCTLLTHIKKKSRRVLKWSTCRAISISLKLNDLSPLCETADKHMAFI